MPHFKGWHGVLMFAKQLNVDSTVGRSRETHYTRIKVCSFSIQTSQKGTNGLPPSLHYSHDLLIYSHQTDS